MGGAMQIGEMITPQAPAEFAAWLAANGGAREIWVVIYKKASGKRLVTYEQLVEVALCYGWIDGLTKSLDGERYVQRFSPRRKKSNWTATNLAIVQRLIAEGRMTAAGLAALPEDAR
jgi:uncharacterized protein YdeI (YjbR/CyaY-like superfamily)